MWFFKLQETQHVAHAILVLAAVAVLGLALGSWKFRNVSLGIAGVLFAGIILGHFGLTIDPDVLHFVREFGLILFVYTIGMQVGPGFLTSLRNQGLPLNLMALSIVLLGALVTVGIAGATGLDWAAAVGLFTGATTNTPALGAAQEALRSLGEVDPSRVDLPALGYAVAYPFGIVGIILSMLLFKTLFRVNLARESEQFHKAHMSDKEPLQRMNLLVDNPNLNGLRLDQIPGMQELEVVVSRIKRVDNPEVLPAHGTTAVQCGDILLAVGAKANLERFRLIVGQLSNVDLLSMPGQVTRQRVVVTRKQVIGKSLRELGLNQVYGVTVSRVTRADIELTALPDLKLQFGDMLQVVGEKDAIVNAAKALGNSLKEVNHTNLIPIFVGIVLGIVVGTYPLTVGDMPAPVRLGLAGGPLLVAIILSRIGKIGPLVWYMPVNANVVLRELGIVLFLACVGLKAGEKFFDQLLHGPGLAWMGYGVLITLVPLLIVGWIGRVILKTNFLNLCGLLAGSMTDPPALAFANSVNQSDAPSVAYATVYPFTMLLRIIVAQLLVLLFC
jgi:putative transport protein